VEMGEMLDDCVTVAADAVIAEVGDVPFDAAGFLALQRAARAGLAPLATTAAQQAAEVVEVAQAVERQLQRLVAPSLQVSVNDAAAQLDRLVRRHFVTTAGLRRLPDLVRYVRGIERRLDKLTADAPRDQHRLRPIVVLERRYADLLARLGRGPVGPELIELGWLLEELRVSEFAQMLGVPVAVSHQRISRELARFGA